MEADDSQAGKGYLICLINAPYHEFPTIVVKRKGGVGGFDESLSQALIDAKAIILFENIRGSINSELFESIMTLPVGTPVGARVPHRAEVKVNPRNFVFQLTSNGFDTTRDLANRSCIIRIVKQGDRPFTRYEEGFILEHVWAKQPLYLGAIYRIVRAWYDLGKQFSLDDCRGVGSFRSWWQRSDWLIRNLFGLPSPLDDHDAAQKRAANPVFGWIRTLFLALKADGLIWHKGLPPPQGRSTTEIIEFCDLRGIEIPGRSSEGSKDERGRVLAVGRLLGMLFPGEKDIFEGEGFSILRYGEDYYDKSRGEERSIKKYVFFEGPDRPMVNALGPPIPPGGLL
jgi:hypothetical protein